jgi:hypothetical protein
MFLASLAVSPTVEVSQNLTVSSAWLLLSAGTYSEAEQHAAINFCWLTL